MTKLRKVLHPYLKSLYPRIYFESAPDKARFPYIVYNIESIVDDGEGFEGFSIEVDGWDMPENGDTTALETLMQTVNDALNKKTLTAEGLAVTFYLDRKIPLRDDNKDIRRRKYIYEARLFGRS